MADTNNNADVKLLALKCKLLSEISTSERQLAYHIKNGAEEIIRLIKAKFENVGHPDSLQFSKDEYLNIINYLECVKGETMYKWKNNSYLTTYYEQIEIKNEILKQL